MHHQIFIYLHQRQFLVPCTLSLPQFLTGSHLLFLGLITDHTPSPHLRSSTAFPVSVNATVGADVAGEEVLGVVSIVDQMISTWEEPAFH